MPTRDEYLRRPVIERVSRLARAGSELAATIDGRDPDAARTALKRAVSFIDRMAGKGIIHRNAASRYKSRLSARLAAPRA